MTDKKTGSNHKKWAAILLALGCIGCCAIPIYAILVGASGAGIIAGAMNYVGVDVLVCLLPLVLIGGYFLVKSMSVKKSCCASPQEKCSNAQCETKAD